jgi:tetratricopeptide (TPR) repeat protein
VRGYLGEGSHWLEAALSKGTGAPDGPRARALRGLGNLVDEMGDGTNARVHLEQALGLYREAGEKYGISRTQLVLGSMDTRDGLRERARDRYEEALEAAREIGATDIVGGILNSLGELARLRGDEQAARAYYQESLEAQGSGTQGRAIPLFNLGQLELRAGNLSAARRLHTESLTIALKLGAKSVIAYGLEGLAGVAVLEGQAERAGRLIGAAEALREAIHARIDATDLPQFERTVAATRSTLGEEAFAAVRATGAALPLEQAVQLAREDSSGGAQPLPTAGLEAAPKPAAGSQATDG